MRICVTGCIVMLLICGFTTAMAQDAQLGVYLEDVSDHLREKLDYDGDGAFVKDIVKGSAAEKFGLKAGDVILVFNGEIVSSTDQLVKEIKKTAPGDEAKILILSNGRTQTLTVRMGAKSKTEPGVRIAIGTKPAKPAKPTMPAPPAKSEPVQKFMYVYEGDKPYMGVGLLDLTDQLAGYFKVKGGVLVSEVVKDSPAAKAKLKAGDVIVAWGNARLNGSGDLHECLQDAEVGDDIELTVVRRGEKQERVISLGERTGGTYNMETYFYTDEDKKLKGFKVPPVPPVPAVPRVPGFSVDQEKHMKEFQKGMKEYQKGMENYQEEMQELRRALKEMHKELQELKKELK